MPHTGILYIMGNIQTQQYAKLKKTILVIGLCAMEKTNYIEFLLPISKTESLRKLIYYFGNTACPAIDGAILKHRNNFRKDFAWIIVRKYPLTIRKTVEKILKECGQEFKLQKEEE